jgi:aldose 1-epimerase
MSVRVEREPFGELNGEVVEVFTMRAPDGAEVRVTPYGGTILSLRVPDRQGRLADVVLGFDTLAEYVADGSYFGALIGRHGNRIRGGRFSLDGATYQLPVNNGRNHLHGGPGGFHKVLWSAHPLDDGVVLRHTSADGEQGYPGTLHAAVTYRWTPDHALSVEYAAETDAPTPVNLTQHTYFNLSGDPTRDILGHQLQLNADGFTPVDDTLIPTGELAPVEGTPFDFRQPKPIGMRIDCRHPQLEPPGGFDHNFVLRGDGSLSLGARVVEPDTGRVLELSTTEPGLQFYSGNFLDGEARGKGGVPYHHRRGFCLEPQHFPDAPNQPAFPSTILRPGEHYTSQTVYRFGVE